LHPLKKDVETARKPTEDPVWDGTLEDGDMIYMPRGWWHVALPMDEPSLHLTVTIVPANGAHFLNWFVHRLKRHAEVRRNLPIFADAEAQSQYLQRLHSLLMEGWTDDVMDQFLGELDAKAMPRPHVLLPQGVSRRVAAIGANSQVRLATGRRLSFETLNGKETRSFHANDTRWECSKEIVPALQALSHNTPRLVSDLCALLPNTKAAPQLKIFLTALAMGGVLWVD
jgi:ribosomal protein L16 Arg81 hydroxylase